MSNVNHLQVAFPAPTQPISQGGLVPDVVAIVSSQLILRFNLSTQTSVPVIFNVKPELVKEFAYQDYDLTVLYERAARLLGFLMEPNQDGIGAVGIAHRLRAVNRRERNNAMTIDFSFLPYPQIEHLNIFMYLIAPSNSILFFDRLGNPHMWHPALNIANFIIVDNGAVINAATLPQVGIIINNAAHQAAARFYLDRLLSAVLSVVPSTTIDHVRFGVGAALCSMFVNMVVNINGLSNHRHFLPGRPPIVVDHNSVTNVMLNIILHGPANYRTPFDYPDVTSLLGATMVAVERYRVEHNIDSSRTVVVDTSASHVIDRYIHSLTILNLDSNNGCIFYFQGGLDAFVYPEDLEGLEISYDANVNFRFSMEDQTLARMQFNLVSAVCAGFGWVYIGIGRYNTGYSLRSRRVMGGVMNVPGAGAPVFAVKFTDRIINPFCNSRVVHALGEVIYRITYNDWITAHSVFKTREYIPSIRKDNSSALNMRVAKMFEKVNAVHAAYNTRASRSVVKAEGKKQIIV